jgi:hypothetical protein
LGPQFSVSTNGNYRIALYKVPAGVPPTGQPRIWTLDDGVLCRISTVARGEKASDEVRQILILFDLGLNSNRYELVKW